MTSTKDRFASDDPHPRNDSARKIPAPLPLGSDLGPTIDRFQEIVAASRDALVTEGPVHADHVLLGLCAEALHHRRLCAELRKAKDALPAPYGNPPATAEQKRQRQEIGAQADDARNRAVQLSRRAAKLKASTPAGIYAKALVVRSSQTAAAILAMSLAEDLIGAPVLRASLWPATTAEHVP
jgi:hypothetical protein